MSRAPPPIASRTCRSRPTPSRTRSTLTPNNASPRRSEHISSEAGRVRAPASSESSDVISEHLPCPRDPITSTRGTSRTPGVRRLCGQDATHR
eukprot:2339683-Rhodomonas_salina.2